jgi:hypothetical protein
LRESIIAAATILMHSVGLLLAPVKYFRDWPSSAKGFGGSRLPHEQCHLVAFTINSASFGRTILLDSALHLRDPLTVAEPGDSVKVAFPANAILAQISHVPTAAT